MKKLTLLTLLVCTILSNSFAQQIDVDVRVRPPYQLSLDGLTNQLLATVRNTNLEVPANNINFKLELYGPRGLRIFSNRVFDVDIDLEPGEIRQFIGNDWDALYESTNLTIEPIDEKQRMIDTQMLRDGVYKICLTAFSTVTNERLSKGVPSDCGGFTVEVPDAPKIIFPQNNYKIPLDGSPLNIIWQQTNLKSSPTYSVEIVDATNFPNVISISEEAFNHAEKVYQNDDISNFQETVEDVDWEKDHIYFIRVTSRFGENEGFLYKFRIHSKPVYIRFEGNAIADDDEEIVKDIPTPLNDDVKEEAIVDTNDMNVKPHYPMANDTIPFLEFPLVVKFSPESDKIKRMKFTASFNNSKNESDTLTWKNGALKFLESKKISNADWSQASLIPLLDVTNTEIIKRGEQYHWSGDVSLFTKAKGDKEDSFNIPQQKFMVGMPKSRLQSPTKDAVVSAGDIKFEWETAQKQGGRILPDYKLVHINKDGVLETRISNVNEHWVLQVFNKEMSTKKEDRVQQYHEKLQININELYNATTRKFDIVKIQEKLYASLNHNFTITENGDYWWRVVWLKNPNLGDAEIENLSSADIYHTTSLLPFTIGEDEPAVAEKSPPTDDECKSNCVIPEPSKTGTIALKVGDTTKIGKFNLVVKSISKDKNKTYTGAGLIAVPFLNNVKVKVEFKDIKINSLNQIYAGTVKAKQDKEFVTRDAKVVDGLEMLGMSKAEAKSLDDAISDASKTVYEMVAGAETTLPLGWDFELDGHRIRLAVMDLDFKSTTAVLDAMALADIPLISDDGSKYKETISFGAKDLCFNPGGLGDDIRFYVPEDLELNPGDKNVFAVRGHTAVRADQTRTDKDYTYLRWGCDGFKELNIALQLKFSREVIIPEDDKGKPAKTGNVYGITNFNIKREDDKVNYLAEIHFSAPFQLPDEKAYGWGFEVSHVWLDLSTTENPPNIKFPTDYQFDTDDSRLANTWKGLWIDKIALKAPHFIETAQTDQKKIELQASNFIIDPKVSFSLELLDFIPLTDKAKIEGSHISIDTVFIAMVQNNFKKAGFTGKIALPIAEDKESQMFKYNVLFDKAKSKDEDEEVFGLVLSAKPAKEDVEIISKGLMMKGKIAKTSFIEIGFRSKVYTKFKLDGTFGFSTELDEKKQDRAFTLNMAGVKIEGLEFDSSKADPFKCDNCLKTSLASPQKTVSGFPITLKNIDMGTNEGNPMLIIEPRLSLMGDGAGLDVSTQINITAKLAKVNDAWNFSIEDAEIKKVTLEPETNLGGIKISGFLEFYKEENKKGTKGALTVLLPGDIGGMMSADFGVHKDENAKPSDFDVNKKWYSYWYVDGTILFGSTGIPMGAINLYGLGGGASHHMTQSSLPDGGKLLSSVSKQIKSTKNEINSSGSKYTPDFDTGLGIKFTTVMGSPGGGKVYNFDVTLSGEFNNSGGLHRLGLEGNARILSNDDNPFTGEAPMQAYVNFGMENFEDADKLLVTGNLIVSLDMLNGTLKGIGKVENGSSYNVPASYSGPKDNILVQAGFMSNNETDQWYFVMGKPQESERAGISIGITLNGKRHEISKTTGYFLAGNALDLIGVDLGLPTPTQAFLNIQNNARNGNFRADSELKEDPEIANAVTNPTSVQGFQFGAAMDYNYKVDLPIFYFNLAMAVGFDLLMKNVEQCTGSTKGKLYTPPGNAGWYTEGQFYAGISGDFGLQVDLYFISGKFSILEAAAAIMLQGNFPNPDGFRGEGDIAYNILGGLVAGNYHFNIKAGERCVAYTDPADALDNLNIIQDLKPNEAKEVSVFATTAASFGIGLNRDFDIPITKTEIKTVRARIESWILKEKNGAELSGTIIMKNDNLAAVFERTDMFKGNKNYTQTIKVMADEFVNGKWTQIQNKEKTSAWFNERTENFKTGESPDVIAEENVNYTYPLKNQKHFLKKETLSNQGYVVLNQAQNQDKKVFDRSTGRDFIARFIKIDGNNTPLETPIRLMHDDRTVAFDVSRLENNQVYLVQLLSKKKTPPQSTNIQASVNDISSAKNRSVSHIPRDVPLAQVIQLTESNVNLLKNGSSFNVKERKLPDDLLFDPSEKILYKYYFKTSKYNTFKEKVTGVNWNSTFNESQNVAGQYFTFNSTWNERPEDYDKFGSDTHRLKVERLIELTINKDKRNYNYPENNYIKHVVKTHLSGPFNKIIGKVNGYGLPFNFSNYKRNYYSEGVYFTQGSLFDTPLTQEETQNAFEAQEQNENQSYTATNSTNNENTGGYQYVTYFVPSLVVSAPQIEIRHRLPPIAIQNLRQMKRVLLPTISEQLDLWEVMTIDEATCYNLKSSSNSKHYSSMYKNRFTKKQLYKYIVNKPYSGDFLRAFDNRTRKDIEKLRKSYRFLAYPKYEDNNKPFQQSFILQYQYPKPSSKKYYKDVKKEEEVILMKQGTHVRVTN